MFSIDYYNTGVGYYYALALLKGINSLVINVNSQYLHSIKAPKFPVVFKERATHAYSFFVSFAKDRLGELITTNAKVYIPFCQYLRHMRLSTTTGINIAILLYPFMQNHVRIAASETIEYTKWCAGLKLSGLIYEIAKELNTTLPNTVAILSKALYTVLKNGYPVTFIIRRAFST